MNIPADCHLAYAVGQEAWYSEVLPGEPAEIIVMAAANDGREVAWEFEVEERVLGGETVIHLRAFNEAFGAFAQIPEFFTLLAAENPTTLAEVREILDRLGAVDRTTRTRPAR